MKRSNPIVLRLDITKTWENNIDVVNFKTGVVILLKSVEYLLNYMRYACLSSGKSLLHNVQCTSLISNNRLYLFLFYFFLNRIIQYKGRTVIKKYQYMRSFLKKKLIQKLRLKLKKKIVLSNSHFFFKRMFTKIERLFAVNYKIPLTIFSANMYRNFFSNFFLQRTTKILKKIIFRPTSGQQTLTQIFLLALYYKNANLLALLVGREIKRQKNHYFTITQLTKMFSFLISCVSTVNCLIIQISGRLNNKDKSAVKFLSLGKSGAIQTFSTDVNYGLYHAVTPIGVFGIRCWVY